METAIYYFIMNNIIYLGVTVQAHFLIFCYKKCQTQTNGKNYIEKTTYLPTWVYNHYFAIHPLSQIHQSIYPPIYP